MKKFIFNNLPGFVFLSMIFFTFVIFVPQAKCENIDEAQLETQGLVHSKVNISSGPFEASLSIDTEPCKTWPTQCSNTGHSAYGATQSNHNPIRINIQVISKTGQPVNNLSFGNFNISCPLMPPSAAPLRKLECGDCFLSGGDGIYAFFVHPDPSSTVRFWQPGTYVMQVQVSTSKSKVVRIFAPFIIP